MKKLLQKTMLSAAAIGLFAAAHAQFPIGGFVPTHTERFDALAAGNYASFAGFAGTAAFSRTTTAGLMIVSPAAAGFLPPVSAPNTMFGRGITVRIRFRAVRNAWGGSFRVPVGAPAGVTQMKVRFFKAGIPVGVPVTAPINNVAWQWRGWELFNLGGFDEVQITGNGPLNGYVGMDNLRVR